jgi:tetratricopeptide (TPR) repeat protein
MAGTDDRREARARFLLGMLLAEVYSNECAAELLGEAVELDPDLVAARVELGFVLARDEDYVGMVEAFREAIRLDPAAARSAAVWEPDEMERLWAILRPETVRTAPPRPSQPPAMPAEFREAGRLAGIAGEHVGAGRDREAVTALEESLRLDPTYSFPLALLALTCLLMTSKGKDGDMIMRAEEVLSEVAPGLAELLFETEG